VTRKQRRLTILGTSVAVLGCAVGLVLYAMSDTIVFFRMPSEIAVKGVQPGSRLRLGGLVGEGSISRLDGQVMTFQVKDATAAIPVRYRGIVPDLFREGQGVIAEGVLNSAGIFEADTVLARHDETYMPREVADALRAQGVWQGRSDAQKTSQR
jgi:cytochrome c-type biogenesis protein CcmE